MNRSGLKCVIYVRVSTEMQVDGFSLEAQKNVVKRFAEREEMIVLNIYEDAGKSGKSIEGRPAFQKMLEDIKNGLEINYILVYKLSRFGRNAADILNSIEFIQSYDINLIATDEGIDSSQTSGKLLISVLSAVYRFVQFYKTYPNIFASLSRQSFLSWSHYLVLLQVFDSEARDWYEKEALKGSWSVRTLQRNVYSDYYHRMLLSQKKELVKDEMLKITAPLQEKKLEFVKNPMILEFLGIHENNS